MATTSKRYPDPLQLTRRECEVLQLLCDGLTNQQIGQRLHIAGSTARGHVQTIMQPFKAAQRQQQRIRRQLANELLLPKI